MKPQHLENFLEMLKSIEILFVVESNGPTTSVTVHNSGGLGYSGFCSEWKFDTETGKFLNVGHWE